jgi:hypothetical protein
MIWNECIQLFYDSTEIDTLDSNKACVEIFTRHS